MPLRDPLAQPIVTFPMPTYAPRERLEEIVAEREAKISEEKKRIIDFSAQFEKDLKAWQVDYAKGFGNILPAIQAKYAPEFLQYRKLSPESDAELKYDIQKAGEYATMSLQQMAKSEKMRTKVLTKEYYSEGNIEKIRDYMYPREKYGAEITEIEKGLTDIEKNANVGAIMFRALNPEKFEITPRFKFTEILLGVVIECFSTGLWRYGSNGYFCAHPLHTDKFNNRSR